MRMKRFPRVQMCTCKQQQKQMTEKSKSKLKITIITSFNISNDKRHFFGRLLTVKHDHLLILNNDTHYLCPGAHGELCSVFQEDNSPHTRLQYYCIVHLNHLLNRRKLTSITNNINSSRASTGILFLGGAGLNVNLPTIIKQTSFLGPFHAWVRSACRSVLWKVSVATDVIACNKFCNKVKVERPSCCILAAFEASSPKDGKNTALRQIMFVSRNLNETCQVGCRWSARHMKNIPAFFFFFLSFLPNTYLNVTEFSVLHLHQACLICIRFYFLCLYMLVLSCMAYRLWPLTCCFNKLF